AGNKISNPPWVKFQSAGWVNFPSAPTTTVYDAKEEAEKAQQGQGEPQGEPAAPAEHAEQAAA
ncbi:hypothetical protein OFL69_15480, partial [Pseudomonas aeruginosa]|nr:hypothetical protein [Pseudomonas aeruginosa]